eukprot:1800371-Amphidinium_carterae.2
MRKSADMASLQGFVEYFLIGVSANYPVTFGCVCWFITWRRILPQRVQVEGVVSNGYSQPSDGLAVAVLAGWRPNATD